MRVRLVRKPPITKIAFLLVELDLGVGIPFDDIRLTKGVLAWLRDIY